MASNEQAAIIRTERGLAIAFKVSQSLSHKDVQWKDLKPIPDE